MKTILFGAGEFGKLYCQYFGDNIILAIADNYKYKGDNCLFGHQIISPSRIPDYDFDYVVICLNDYFDKESQIALEQILHQLVDIGIDENKILINKALELPFFERVVFLREFSETVYRRGITGNVAECGVYRGNFAAWINEFFPDKKLYLFDSFIGFRECDLAAEPNKKAVNAFLADSGNCLYNGNEHITMLRCVHRNNVIIKKGFVPDTFTGIENESFCFVNLDMDIYAPTLEALRFFAPRLVKGGIIMLHDYFFEETPGIKEAVNKFSQERDFIRFPVGDKMSVALLFQ